MIADFANAYLKRNLNDIGFNNILLKKKNNPKKKTKAEKRCEPVEPAE